MARRHPPRVSNDEKSNIEMFYRRIFDNMHEGAIIFGFTVSDFRNGFIIYSNRRFGEMVKRSVSKLIGSSIFDFVLEEDVQVIKATLDDLKNGRTAQREIHLKREDGELVDVNFSIGSLSGKAVTYAIVTDLTEIRKKEQESKRLASELLTAQEKERKRIASELHDGLAASLSGIKMALQSKLDSMMNNTASTIRIEDLIARLQTNIEEVRRIMASLHPSILDDLGIAATINWYCREYQKACPHIHVEQQVSVAENEIPAPLKTAIYRVCQESFNNIAKHSKANFVTLSLKKSNKKIELAIKDNGQGFDLNDKPKGSHGIKGFGLESMKERVEMLGGSFSVTSSAEVGTMIYASWSI